MYNEACKVADPRSMPMQSPGLVSPNGGPGMHQLLEAAFTRLCAKAMHLESLNARFQDCISKAGCDRASNSPMPPPPSFQQLPEAMHKVIDHLDNVIGEIERKVFGS